MPEEVLLIIDQPLCKHTFYPFAITLSDGKLLIDSHDELTSTSPGHWRLRSITFADIEPYEGLMTISLCIHKPYARELSVLITSSPADGAAWLNDLDKKWREYRLSHSS